MEVKSPSGAPRFPASSYAAYAATRIAAAREWHLSLWRSCAATWMTNFHEDLACECLNDCWIGSDTHSVGKVEMHSSCFHRRLHRHLRMWLLRQVENVEILDGRVGGTHCCGNQQTSDSCPFHFHHCRWHLVHYSCDPFLPDNCSDARRWCRWRCRCCIEIDVGVRHLEEASSFRPGKGTWGGTNENGLLQSQIYPLLKNEALYAAHPSPN